MSAKKKKKEVPRFSEPGRSFLSRLEPQWKWIFLIYLFLAMANVRSKAFITGTLFDGTLVLNHERLIQGAYTAPEQYRLLQYYVPELIHKLLRIHIIDAYLLQRLLWTAMTFFVFHIYLRKWFDSRVSMAGTLFLAAIMQWTYFNHLQESEPLNIFIFLVGLYAIRENALWQLFVILAIGSFNKLTVIYLPIIYFLCWYKIIDLKKLLSQTLILFIPVVCICGAIRWYYKSAPYMTSFFQLQYNLEGILASIRHLPFAYFFAFHLGILFLYGIFWIIAFLSFREKPLFLRRAAFIVPVYVIGHLLIARVDEIRLFLPLAAIIVPMGLFYLFKKNGGT